MFEYIFFDLDGTLTDPKEGITGAAAYAAKHYLNIEITDRDTLLPFIGPPLEESFMKYFDLTPEQAKEAIASYREYYRPRGVFENTVYEGIPEMLEKLKKEGKKVYMATSKPEYFALQIAEHYGFDKYFDGITGSTMDGSLVKKADVLALAMRRAGDPQKNHCVMVGDRLHDIVGAHENGITAVGVLYGYGSMEEFKEYSADKTVATVSELSEYLLSN